MRKPQMLTFCRFSWPGSRFDDGQLRLGRSIVSDHQLVRWGGQSRSQANYKDWGVAIRCVRQGTHFETGACIEGSARGFVYPRRRQEGPVTAGWRGRTTGNRNLGAAQRRSDFLGRAGGRGEKRWGGGEKQKKCRVADPEGSRSSPTISTAKYQPTSAGVLEAETGGSGCRTGTPQPRRSSNPSKLRNLGLRESLPTTRTQFYDRLQNTQRQNISVTYVGCSDIRGRIISGPEGPRRGASPRNFISRGNIAGNSTYGLLSRWG